MVTPEQRARNRDRREKRDREDPERVARREAREKRERNEAEDRYERDAYQRTGLTAGQRAARAEGIGKAIGWILGIVLVLLLLKAIFDEPRGRLDPYEDEGYQPGDDPHEYGAPR